MPECYLMPSPVFVHNNIAIYPTYRNNQLSQPREFHFTTDCAATEHDDPRSFDVRDFAYLAAPSRAEDLRDRAFTALTENPGLLPRAKGEEIEELTLDGSHFYHTTPEQDQACLLAARISAQLENYWPAIDMYHVTMPNGDTKSVYAVPSGTTPDTQFDISLVAYDHRLSSYNFQALLTEKPDRVIQATWNFSELVSACCDVLDVERPDHLKTPLVEKLNQAKEKTAASPSSPAQEKDTER